jgi:hypothetical protein
MTESTETKIKRLINLIKQEKNRKDSEL